MAEIFLTIFFISVLLFFLGSGIWVALSMIGVSAIGMMLFTSRPVGDAMATTIWGTASSFFALAYTFHEKAHIRITLFLEKLKKTNKKLAEIWCLSVASFFSGFMAFYFVKMTIVSVMFEERSEGADEILIWIPQSVVAVGALIFFICILHHLIFSIIEKKIN